MPTDVEKVKSQLDIVDVVSEYVRLKQSGANWKGLCPFHPEKTPSFMVHRDKQIWHCFGCGIGGDMFEFIEKVENIDFPETLELLARKAGVTLEPRSRALGEQGQRQRLFQLLEAAAAFYSAELKSAVAARARQYIKERAISDDSVQTFGIGYAPPEWDKLLNALRGQGFTPDELVAAGLAIKSDRGPGWYDRFRDRLIFPINDAQGRPVGFGGRTLDKAAKEAKYINSPQGPIYNKSAILYNLDRAKAAVKELGYAVLVEGYMDTVAAWQAGVKNVMATSGTALTPEQAKLLKRYTQDVRLTFDADAAGAEAAWRGIDVMLEYEFEVKVLILPFGKDPDECVRQEAAAFVKAVQQAVPFGDYMLQHALSKFDSTTREGKKKIADYILGVFDRFRNPIDRDYYYKLLSKELDVDERFIRERLPKVVRSTSPSTAPRSESAAPTPAVPLDRHHLLSERFLSLLLRRTPELEQLTVELAPEMLAAEVQRELYRRISVFYTERRQLDWEELRLELQSESELSRLADYLFLLGERDYADWDEAAIARELDEFVRLLKTHHLKAELKRLGQALTEAERAGRLDEMEVLELKYKELNDERSRLEAAT